VTVLVDKNYYRVEVVEVMVVLFYSSRSGSSGSIILYTLPMLDRQC
jgi:hypothetical protein